LADSNGSALLVIGAGNETRGDDAVGLVVVRKLKEKIAREAVVVEETGDGASLMERWKGFNAAMLVDAAQSGVEPGRIHRFEAHKSPLPAGLFQYSTHSFGVSQAIELAKTLNQLPRWFMVYGIEGKCFDENRSMSPMVERAAQELVESLAIEILQHQRSVT
jgi:hydrogenase maturation protease